MLAGTCIHHSRNYAKFYHMHMQRETTGWLFEMYHLGRLWQGDHSSDFIFLEILCQSFPGDLSRDPTCQLSVKPVLTQFSLNLSKSKAVMYGRVVPLPNLTDPIIIIPQNDHHPLASFQSKITAYAKCGDTFPLFAMDSFFAAGTGLCWYTGTANTQFIANYALIFASGQDSQVMCNK